MHRSRLKACFAATMLMVLIHPAVALSQFAEAPDTSLRDSAAAGEQSRGTDIGRSSTYANVFGSSLALSDEADSNLFSLPLIGRLRDIGYRVSSSDGRKFDALTRHALFVELALPWEWSAPDGYAVAPYLSMEVGRFSRGSEQRSFISIGPAVRVTHRNWGSRFFVDAGLSPTVIDRAKYGDRDFGTSFNFSSHLGFGFRFGAREEHFVKLRYEHISNGGIDENNPGVNMVGIDFVFWGR